jgi:transcriptional antiterminator RfaH
MSSVSNALDAKSYRLGGDERWFLVHSMPKSEMRAAFHLGVQGFRTFVPHHLKTTRHARQLRTLLAPFFPRYLFVVLDLTRDRWLSIRSTIGVSSLVCSGNRPLMVPAGIVENLIARDDPYRSSPFQDDLKAGQLVRIGSGSFAGFVGTLERLDDNRRVSILLEMMGSSVSVGIERFRLSPVAS